MKAVGDLDQGDSVLRTGNVGMISPSVAMPQR
jgi:hypothetical protein